VDKTIELNDQLEKFKALARELECDEDEAAFDERLRKMAAQTKVKEGPAE